MYSNESDCLCVHTASEDHQRLLAATIHVERAPIRASHFDAAARLSSQTLGDGANVARWSFLSRTSSRDPEAHLEHCLGLFSHSAHGTSHKPLGRTSSAGLCLGGNLTILSFSVKFWFSAFKFLQLTAPRA